MEPPPDNTRPRLVILGTGFAGFSLVKTIDTRFYDVTVVSPRNHFIFTPLLPSTTVGTIEFRSIIEPVRSAKKSIVFHQAFAKEIDVSRKRVLCHSALGGSVFSLSYDLLVIAVGAENNTYGVPGVREHAYFLKDLADARRIRQGIIEQFERASTPSVDEQERRRLLHFVVVGGGPTGVEFAAEMHDFLVEDLPEAYPHLVSFVHITLLEASQQILNTFDEELSRYTLKLFSRQKIHVRTGSPVVRVGSTTILLADGSEIPYGLVVWSTGVGPNELVRSLSFPKDSSSRIITDEYFQVAGVPDVYALGDCATIRGKHLPATAQVAQQEGAYVARQLNSRARGKRARPFKYRHYGMLAYVGSGKALADLSAFKGKGFLTWLFWRSAYLTRLVSWKNKILVVFDWFKTRAFGRDVSRF
jgi:NADH:ubiquinone reductase (non-electrogenic)